MSKKALMVLGSALVALLASGAALAQEGHPSAKGTAMVANLTVGRPGSEAVWERAEVATNFVQRQPQPGEPATERTEVRIVRDYRTLYIGVRAYDSEPGGIIAQEMRVDGGASGFSFGS